MLDLETLGRSPDAAIVSIGAVQFDKAYGPGEWPSFYRRLDLTSVARSGGTISLDTITWWMGQDDEARSVFTKDPEEQLHIKDALKEFSVFLSAFTERAEIRIWGNGAAFDNVILRQAYLKAGVRLPWEFWEDRCYRTIRSLAPEVEIERIGIKHNALDDAVSQAEHLIRIADHLGINLEE